MLLRTYRVVIKYINSLDKAAEGKKCAMYPVFF